MMQDNEFAVNLMEILYRLIYKIMNATYLCILLTNDLIFVICIMCNMFEKLLRKKTVIILCYKIPYVYIFSNFLIFEIY